MPTIQSIWTRDGNTIDSPLILEDDGNGNPSIPTAIISDSDWVDVPSSPTATGTTGQKAFDSEYVYVCIATNTWRRAGLMTWL